jgi:hypothetical protein
MKVLATAMATAASLSGATAASASGTPRDPRSARPVVVQVDGGFDWTDASIGAAVSSGVWLAVAGAVVIRSTTKGDHR